MANSGARAQGSEAVGMPSCGAECAPSWSTTLLAGCRLLRAACRIAPAAFVRLAGAALLRRGLGAALAARRSSTPSAQPPSADAVTTAGREGLAQGRGTFMLVLLKVVERKVRGGRCRRQDMRHDAITCCSRIGDGGCRRSRRRARAWRTPPANGRSTAAPDRAPSEFSSTGRPGAVRRVGARTDEQLDHRGRTQQGQCGESRRRSDQDEQREHITRRLRPWAPANSRQQQRQLVLPPGTAPTPVRQARGQPSANSPLTMFTASPRPWSDRSSRTPPRSKSGPAARAANSGMRWNQLISPITRPATPPGGRRPVIGAVAGDGATVFMREASQEGGWKRARRDRAAARASWRDRSRRLRPWRARRSPRAPTLLQRRHEGRSARVDGQHQHLQPVTQHQCAAPSRSTSRAATLRSS